MSRKAGIIYYTDSKLEDKIAFPVIGILQAIGFPVVSCSLKPMDFGDNVVLDLKPGIITMFNQILTALEKSEANIVFFCEHDVLYHKSHFHFEPEYDNVFYYNTNVWQWKYPEDFAVTYDNLTSLSGLCVYRKFAIEHYKKRLKLVEKNGWVDDGKQPSWAKRMGYEPGTKSERQEIVSKDVSECWRSKYPNIDIRHKGTFTPQKMSLDNFKHKPINWKTIKVSEIIGWNLYDIFNIKSK